MGSPPCTHTHLIFIKMIGWQNRYKERCSMGRYAGTLADGGGKIGSISEPIYPRRELKDRMPNRKPEIKADKGGATRKPACRCRASTLKPPAKQLREVQASATNTYTEHAHTHIHIYTHAHTRTWRNHGFAS